MQSQSEEPMAELVAGGSLIEQDVVAKANAGAALLYAIYHHPRAFELLKPENFGSQGLMRAYMAAQDAYWCGGH